MAVDTGRIATENQFPCRTLVCLGEHSRPRRLPCPSLCPSLSLSRDPLHWPDRDCPKGLSVGPARQACAPDPRVRPRTRTLPAWRMRRTVVVVEEQRAILDALVAAPLLSLRNPVNCPAVPVGAGGLPGAPVALEALEALDDEGARAAPEKTTVATMKTSPSAPIPCPAGTRPRSSAGAPPASRRPGPGPPPPPCRTPPSASGEWCWSPGTTSVCWCSGR